MQRRSSACARYRTPPYLTHVHGVIRLEDLAEPPAAEQIHQHVART